MTQSSHLNESVKVQSIKKKFPIGIQTFSVLRENEQYYYIDKTKKIIELIHESNYIFLSRPRRFGKSLTLDTIAELFSANKPLFNGLYAEHHWNWTQKHPIIRFNFAKSVEKSVDELKNSLTTQIEENARRLQIELNHNISPVWLLNDLINQTIEKYKEKVVILIDEYDKPILDNLENTTIAMQMRDELRSFYSIIKGQDAHIRFAMLTGVSKFSKINLFSGLNNLLDITLDRKFSDVCGYTQIELEMVFASELVGVDLAELKFWYNGYNWGGESVYNPFDILLFLNSDKKVFKDYWVETGNSTFLIDKLIHEQVNITQIRQEIANNDELSSFEVGDISPIALMFQTGYLTIDQVKTGVDGELYSLKFPNMEVQQSLNKILLNAYLNKKINTLMVRSKLYEHLLNHNIQQVLNDIKAFFASIPHDWHRNNTIAHYEGYWASVFYALFASLGFVTITEDSTHRGNVDMTLIVEHHVYIFEFKVIHQEQDMPTGRAVEQILQKNYADKYRVDGYIIHQIGVEFNEYNREVIFDILQ